MQKDFTYIKSFEEMSYLIENGLFQFYIDEKYEVVILSIKDDGIVNFVCYHYPDDLKELLEKCDNFFYHDDLIEIFETFDYHYENIFTEIIESGRLSYK